MCMQYFYVERGEKLVCKMQFTSIGLSLVPRCLINGTYMYTSNTHCNKSGNDCDELDADQNDIGCWPTEVMAQSAVSCTCCKFTYHSLTIKFRTTLVSCAFAALLLDQSRRESVILCWKSVQDLTNQEQAFSNRPQTCRGEYQLLIRAPSLVASIAQPSQLAITHIPQPPPHTHTQLGHKYICIQHFIHL